MNMKSRTVTLAAVMALLLAIAAPVQLAAQSHYSVVELGELGGTSGSANGINDRGWITGADNLAGDLTSMATLWMNGSTIPLSPNDPVPGVSEMSIDAVCIGRRLYEGGDVYPIVWILVRRNNLHAWDNIGPLVRSGVAERHLSRIQSNRNGERVSGVKHA